MKKNKAETLEDLLERLECGTAMLWVFSEGMDRSSFGAADYYRAMCGVWYYMADLTEKFRALTCADTELDKAAQM